MNVLAKKWKVSNGLAVLLLILIFSASFTSQSKESYQITTIMINYSGSDKQPIQQITISHPDQKTELYYITNKSIKQRKKEAIAKTNATVLIRDLTSKFDNKIVLEKINELLQNGWEIHSHDFDAINDFSSDYPHNLKVESNKFYSYYIFKR